MTDARETAVSNKGLQLILDHMRVKGFLHNTTAWEIEKTAEWMRDSLRIGGIRVCRELVKQALELRSTTNA